MLYKHTFNLNNVTKPQIRVDISKIYFILLYISIHQHFAVDSATTIRVSYKNTNNIKINAQNAKLKPPDATPCKDVYQLYTTKKQHKHTKLYPFLTITYFEILWP
jgi:hypothetical protein